MEKETIVLIISAILIIPLFCYMAGYEKGYKSNRWLIDLNKKRLQKAEFKVSELTDGLGGKCDVCKGFGVTGEDGQYDCFDCGGTGLRSLKSYVKISEKILDKAASDAQKVLISVANIKKSLEEINHD